MCLAYSLALLVVAQSLDFVTTVIGIEHFGIESEANIFLRALLFPHGSRAVAYHALGVIISSLAPFALLTLFVQFSRLSVERKRALLMLTGLLFSLPPMIAGYSNLIQIWLVARLPAATRATLIAYLGIVSLTWLFLAIAALTRRDLLYIFLTVCRRISYAVCAFRVKTRMHHLIRKMQFLSSESRKMLLKNIDRNKEQGSLISVETGLNALLGPCGALLNRVRRKKERRSKSLQSPRIQ